MDEVERILRDSLTERAHQAPDADRLTDRILSAGDWPVSGVTPRRWQRWATPLVAAAVVAATVVGILLAGQADHPSQKTATRPSRSLSVPVAPARTSPGVAPSTSQPSVSSTSDSSLPVQPPAGGAVPAQFRIVDLTFVGDNYGFALGSALSSTGDGTRQTAIVRTMDGTSWRGLHTPPAGTAQNTGGCGTTGCLSSIRFANALEGYTFGSAGLFMTTDGGDTWSRQTPLNVTHLEVANGTVVAVSATGQVLRASVGSSAWTADLTSLASTGTQQLARVLNDVYYLSVATTAEQRSTLYASGDGGLSWTDQGDPCAQGSDAVADGVAADGAVVLLCRSRADGTSVALVSTDVGNGFTPVGGRLPRGATLISGASSSAVLVAGANSPVGSPLYRNGTVVVRDATTGSAMFLGFESDSIGRWVSGDGSQLWTTTDGGLTWAPAPIR